MAAQSDVRRIALVPNPKLLAIRVANELEKPALLASDTKKLFTEPHYNGRPAQDIRRRAVRRQPIPDSSHRPCSCSSVGSSRIAYLRASSGPSGTVG